MTSEVAVELEYPSKFGSNSNISTFGNSLNRRKSVGSDSLKSATTRARLLNELDGGPERFGHSFASAEVVRDD